MNAPTAAPGAAPATPVQRRRGWRRWLPRGMAGQLLLMLLGGLLVTHLVGVLVLSREHGEMHPLSRRESIAELQQMVQAAQALAGRPDLDTVLTAFSGPQGQFHVLAQPPTVGDEARTPEAAAIEETLQALLGLPASAVRVHIDNRPAQAAPAIAQRQDRGPTLTQVRMRSWIRLASGQWLASEQWPELRRRWWWPVSFWLQMSLLPVVLVAGYAAHRLLRPSRALVDAAARISRGERVEPLTLQGPQEMRDILQAFNEMQDRLHRFVEDRTRMLAAISHDFRTPITSLRLRVEMVEDAALRDAMVRTLDGMRAMVEETLRFAQDDAALEPTQTVRVHTLLNEVVDDQQALGRDVRWSTETSAGEPPAAYRCRPVALQRALANLIDNAVRYGHRARVALHASADAVQIDIDDDGPGIPEAHTEDAFKPFTRLHNAARQANASDDKATSTGLGLAIARSCVHAHGGDIQLLRAPLGGLRARITLPL